MHISHIVFKFHCDSLDSGVSNCRIVAPVCDRAPQTCDKPNPLSTIKVVKFSVCLTNRCRHLVINLILRNVMHVHHGSVNIHETLPTTASRTQRYGHQAH